MNLLSERAAMMSAKSITNLFHLLPYINSKTPENKETILPMLKNGYTRFSFYSSSPYDCTYIVPVSAGHKYADNYKKEYHRDPYGKWKNPIYFYDAEFNQIQTIEAYDGTPVLAPTGSKYMRRRIYYGNTQWHWNNWMSELIVWEVK